MPACRPGCRVRASASLCAPIFHGQNLLWHTATVLLLFAILRRMTGAPWRSALVAALFAVHPLHVESVAWASERKDVLSAFFWVLTLLAYHRYTQRPHFGRYLLVVGPFVLGLLAKPMLVTLPCVLLLLDFWPLQRWQLGTAPPASATSESLSPAPGLTSWLLLEKTPLFLLAVGASQLAILAQGSAGAISTPENTSWTARLANVPVSYGWYLEKTFWPSGLALFYPHPRDNWHWAGVLVSLAVLLAVTVVALLRARSWPWLVVGWLWFLGTLVPVIGLVQIGAQARADRYTYIPHIGLFLALVWTAAELLARLRLPGAAPAWRAPLIGGTGLAVAWLALLTTATRVQIGHWRNGETIWMHALTATTDNYRAHFDLAGLLLRRAEAKRDKQLLDRAEQHFEEAVRVGPPGLSSRDHLVRLLIMRGKWEEAARQVREAIRLDPQSTNARHTLGSILREQRRYPEAAESFQWVLQRTPEAADTHAELGQVLWQLRQPEKAEKEWRTALQLNPREPEALDGLGLVLLRQGQPRAALEQFVLAVQANPNLARVRSHLGLAQGCLEKWAEASDSQRQALLLETPWFTSGQGRNLLDLSCFHRRLARALQELGQVDAAAREYAEALRLEPDWPRTSLQEAWKLATAAQPAQRDARTAHELASAVCQASQQPSVEALDALAAAQAALGRYPEAARTARQALDRAAPRQSQAIAARLRLYEQDKAFTDSGD